MRRIPHNSRTHFPCSAHVAPPRSQRGAVLIASLLILVALTLIGISAMNTGQLEQKMAASNQEALRSFQDAESVLSTAFTSPDHWSAAKSDCSPSDANFDEDDDKLAGTDNYGRSQSCFLGFTPVPDDSLWSDNFQIANFDFEGHSRSQTNLTSETKIETRIHLGGYQYWPK
ncbi:MAG: pilus assembly PilX family protein [Gammaproteobacteria bacterium]